MATSHDCHAQYSGMLLYMTPCFTTPSTRAFFNLTQILLHVLLLIVTYASFYYTFSYLSSQIM